MTTPHTHPNDSRRLDAQVAETVMGWSKIEYFSLGSGLSTVVGLAPSGYRLSVPHYSTEISAAWEVVEHLKASGFDGQAHVSPAMNCYARFENARGRCGEFQHPGPWDLETPVPP